MMGKIHFIWNEQDQIRFELAYGKMAWSANVIANISGWPRDLGKARFIFSEVNDNFLDQARIGSAFTKPFEVETDWGNHQMETTAFYHGDQPPHVPAPEYSFTGIVIRKHKNASVELTLSAYFSGISPDDFYYTFALGLIYDGTDELFQPLYPKLTLADKFKYTVLNQATDQRSPSDKFPLLKREYGARICQCGDTSKDLSELADLKLELKDARLEALARSFYSEIKQGLKQL